MPTPYPTFLMLDIEGSTKIARSLSRKDYLERLHAPLYAELNRLFGLHGGELSGTPRGDDAVVVFENVNDALTCAVAIQKSLPKLRADDPAENVRKVAVRIVVHTAREQVMPDEHGLYQMAEDIIYTARLMTNVDGGQIIASDETHRVSDRKQWEWQCWPNRRVKNWQEPQKFYELLYEGWTSREPGAQFMPGWFRETNHYVVRPELENRVSGIFALRTGNKSAYRLVTLHGFGGMGKTRLAMQCCLNAAGLFEGRLYLARLDGISDDALVSDEARREYLVGSVAKAFGLKSSPDAPITHETLPERLPADGNMLLLLDNYETVKGEASARLIAQLLEGCPGLHLLVTGRNDVGLTPLEIVQDVDGLQPGEARDLLLTRIREKTANFDRQPTALEEQAIAQILHETARIPLALELAAAHVGDLELAEIARELSDEPMGEMTEMPEGRYGSDPSWRHHALEKCYNWSWRLLDAEAQAALLRLSLFADHCPSEEISVCFPTVKRAHLTRLQQAALVVRSGKEGKSAYSLLRPTRAYARKRLNAEDRDESVRKHFIAYYQQVAQENSGLGNREDAVKRARLETAWRQAMSAADVAAELEDADACGAIADWLAHFVDRQALWTEAEPLFVQALAIRRKALPAGHPTIAGSLNNLAGLYQSQGRYKEAEPLYMQALEIDRLTLGENHPGYATHLNNLAALYESQGRYEEAEPLYTQALEIRRNALPDGHPSIATGLNNLAGLYRSQGRYEEAEPLYMQALEIRRTALPQGHPDIAGSLNNLAELYELQGSYEEAEPLYTQAVGIMLRGLGPRHPSTVTVLGNFVMLLIWQERQDALGAVLEEMPELWETLQILMEQDAA